MSKWIEINRTNGTPLVYQVSNIIRLSSERYEPEGYQFSDIIYQEGWKLVSENRDGYRYETYYIDPNEFYYWRLEILTAAGKIEHNVKTYENIELSLDNLHLWSQYNTLQLVEDRWLTDYYVDRKADRYTYFNGGKSKSRLIDVLKSIETGQPSKDGYQYYKKPNGHYGRRKIEPQKSIWQRLTTLIK